MREIECTDSINTSLDPPHRNDKTTDTTTKPIISNHQQRNPAQNFPGFDLIYHNMCADSDFITFRAGADPYATIEDAIKDVARHIATGLYEIISISGSKHSLVVVMGTELSKAELWGRGFPYADSEASDIE